MNLAIILQFLTSLNINDLDQCLLLLANPTLLYTKYPPEIRTALIKIGAINKALREDVLPGITAGFEEALQNKLPNDPSLYDGSLPIKLSKIWLIYEKVEAKNDNVKNVALSEDIKFLKEKVLFIDEKYQNDKHRILAVKKSILDKCVNNTSTLAFLTSLMSINENSSTVDFLNTIKDNINPQLNKAGIHAIDATDSDSLIDSLPNDLVLIESYLTKIDSLIRKINGILSSKPIYDREQEQALTHFVKCITVLSQACNIKLAQLAPYSDSDSDSENSEENLAPSQPRKKPAFKPVDQIIPDQEKSLQESLLEKASGFAESGKTIIKKWLHPESFEDEMRRRYSSLINTLLTTDEKDVPTFVKVLRNKFDAADFGTRSHLNHLVKRLPDNINDALITKLSSVIQAICFQNEYVDANVILSGLLTAILLKKRRVKTASDSAASPAKSEDITKLKSLLEKELRDKNVNVKELNFMDWITDFVSSIATRVTKIFSSNDANAPPRAPLDEEISRIFSKTSDGATIRRTLNQLNITDRVNLTMFARAQENAARMSVMLNEEDILKLINSFNLHDLSLLEQNSSDRNAISDKDRLMLNQIAIMNWLVMTKLGFKGKLPDEQIIKKLILEEQFLKILPNELNLYDMDLEEKLIKIINITKLFRDKWTMYLPSWGKIPEKALKNMYSAIGKKRAEFNEKDILKMLNGFNLEDLEKLLALDVANVDDKSDKERDKKKYIFSQITLLIWMLANKPGFEAKLPDERTFYDIDLKNKLDNILGIARKFRDKLTPMPKPGQEEELLKKLSSAIKSKRESLDKENIKSFINKLAGLDETQLDIQANVIFDEMRAIFYLPGIAPGGYVSLFKSCIPIEVALEKPELTRNLFLLLGKIEKPDHRCTEKAILSGFVAAISLIKKKAFEQKKAEEITAFQGRLSAIVNSLKSGDIVKAIQFLKEFINLQSKKSALDFRDPKLRAQLFLTLDAISLEALLNIEHACKDLLENIECRPLLGTLNQGITNFKKFIPGVEDMLKQLGLPDKESVLNIKRHLLQDDIDEIKRAWTNYIDGLYGRISGYDAFRNNGFPNNGDTAAMSRAVDAASNEINADPELNLLITQYSDGWELKKILEENLPADIVKRKFLEALRQYAPKFKENEVENVLTRLTELNTLDLQLLSLAVPNAELAEKITNFNTNLVSLTNLPGLPERYNGTFGVEISLPDASVLSQKFKDAEELRQKIDSLKLINENNPALTKNLDRLHKSLNLRISIKGYIDKFISALNEKRIFAAALICKEFDDYLQAVFKDRDYKVIIIYLQSICKPVQLDSVDLFYQFKNIVNSGIVTKNLDDKIAFSSLQLGLITLTTCLNLDKPKIDTTEPITPETLKHTILSVLPSNEAQLKTNVQTLRFYCESTLIALRRKIIEDSRVPEAVVIRLGPKSTRDPEIPEEKIEEEALGLAIHLADGNPNDSLTKNAVSYITITELKKTLDGNASPAAKIADFEKLFKSPVTCATLKSNQDGAVMRFLRRANKLLGGLIKGVFNVIGFDFDTKQRFFQKSVKHYLEGENIHPRSRPRAR